jgi:membrane-associated phospholipid phosphatase
MTSPTNSEPVEEQLADRLSARHLRVQSSRVVRVLRQLGRMDRAAYRTVADMHTRPLDRPLRRVSDFADFSKPWFLIAGALALFGGARGRRAAVTGVAALGLTSFLVNQSIKLISERRRPDRTRDSVPRRRWVRMPRSNSFPSGHAASAAAFAVSVGDLLPPFRGPLRAAAAIVAFSRVYTGVHYPADIVAGAAIGVLVGRVSSTVALRLRASSRQRLEDRPEVQT